MVTYVGGWVIRLAVWANGLLELMVQTFRQIFTPPWRIHEIVKQLYFVANQSAFIVAFCVAFAAIVTILEASFHMKLVIQNDSMVPGFAALLILRELGAVTAALLLTSRVGAGIAAEVGTMQITEQIDAYKMLGMDPIKYIVVPRFIACTLGAGILTLVSNLVCLYAAMLISSLKLGYTEGSFLVAMNAFIDFKDLMFAAVKGLFFGAAIPLISCYYGFRCKAGAEGVGSATTNSVVMASVAIIVMDFILGWFFSNFY
jgi:phospholipid/cholesterol/gamma-HCH transport system permease protein